MSKQSIHDRIMSRNRSENAVRNAAGAWNGAKRNWPKTAAFSLAGVAVVGAISFAAMRYDAVAGLFSQPAAAEAKPALADTPFLQHAKQAGLETCSTVFPMLGELLTNGSQYNVQSSWNNEAPDKHAVQALVGMDYATDGYTGSAGGIVFASPVGSACEGAMVRVAPFSMPCANIPSVLPAGSKLANNLGKIAVYALGNKGGNALLLPTGDSCVVISVVSAAQ